MIVIGETPQIAVGPLCANRDLTQAARHPLFDQASSLATQARHRRVAGVVEHQHPPMVSAPVARTYTTRRRRLSSITRAPCRRVMGMPGQRWQAARKVASATW
jgi:hypothetical protein